MTAVAIYGYLAHNVFEPLAWRSTTIIMDF
jgi:hypothetical protein